MRGVIMKRLLFWCALFSFLAFIIQPLDLLAEDYLSEADRIYEKGGGENYKRSIDVYLKALKENPHDYEANWKCARACREYGEAIKRQAVEGWKKACARYGKEGMKYAEKAIEQQPGRPDGHYYYGLNVGIYSDGVSILTALAEGLKNKTQKSLEKAYELDKMYNEAGAMLSIGRFWAVVPWPYKDRKKALKFYREYQQTRYFHEKAEGKLYLAEVLLELKGEKNKEEAKDLLKKALESDEKYFAEWAERLLNTIEKKEDKKEEISH
jgi:tetratricopeptide (TPR) repeat protein